MTYSKCFLIDNNGINKKNLYRANRSDCSPQTPKSLPTPLCVNIFNPCGYNVDLSSKALYAVSRTMSSSNRHIVVQGFILVSPRTSLLVVVLKILKIGNFLEN
jgi:hypothetical protein